MGFTDKHNIFIINIHLKYAIHGLHALVKYCRESGCEILLDTQLCVPGCTKKSYPSQDTSIVPEYSIKVITSE